LLSAGLIDLIGFEPQPEALAQLEAHKGPRERYLSHAVGDGRTATLHFCYASGMTSLLEPAGTDFFHHFPTWSRILKTEELGTCRLDDIGEIQQMDMLKIDVQGGELAVFENGVERLSKTLVIQTEVSFFPLYFKQPGFGAIDVFLRSLGFMPHMFAAINKRIISPMVIAGDGAIPINQVLEADIVYVRSLDDLAMLSARELEKIALLLHGCYGSVDLALRCLMEADRQDGRDRASRYLPIVQDLSIGA